MARILIIDDDRSLLHMVKLMVEREGHEALLANSGEEGLSLARSQRPNLAIIDLMMPGMSGYEVTQRLRDDAVTARTPVLILTARSQPIDEKMARDAGANGFLAKPVTAEELMVEVRALLSTAGEAEPASSEPVVTVLGLRGGSGGTTIAVNLALALMARVNRVCLVDLSPFSGHAALHLHLVPRQSWGDFLPGGSATGALPSPEQVTNAVVAHQGTNLAILPAPAVPLYRTMSEQFTEGVLNTLAGAYDLIVVDAPSLGPATTAAIRASRVIMIPMSDDVVSIQTTTGVLRVLDEMDINMDRVRVVLNHVRPDAALPLDAVQKAIRRPVYAELPYEAAQTAALGRGTPLVVSQPKSAFAQGILRLARAV